MLRRDFRLYRLTGVWPVPERGRRGRTLRRYAEDVIGCVIVGMMLVALVALAIP